jgi:hypothetical protein
MTPQEMITAFDSVKPGDQAGSYGEGYADGQQAEHDRFWGAYCTTSNTDCDYMFAGQRWNARTFTPPAVTLTPKRAMYMFSRANIQGDLAAICEQFGFVLDFSNCAMISSMFANAIGITRVGVMDFRSAKNESDTVFINASGLVTIDKLLVGENTKRYNSWFSGATALENITFEGDICSTISFANCAKLTNASVQSIIDHLKDLTGATAQKVSFHSDVLLNLTVEQYDAIAAKNWTI